MDGLSSQEQQWLLKMRQIRSCLFIGIDHHSAQLTVAIASGQQLMEQSGSRNGFSWVKTKVFAQDGVGYLALLDHLADIYPEVPRERYLFLSEPSYAKPCSQFLLNAGLEPSQVLWVDTRKVSQYRKSHHLTSAGKNDADDARTMVAMLFGATSEASAPLRLFMVPTLDLRAEALSGLAEEHRRLVEQRVQVQNKIFQKVLLLFPEARRVWGRTEKALKPDGGEYSRVKLALFDSKTPMRVLHAFPTAVQLAEAGFEGVWARVGGKGVGKAPLKELLRLAEGSAGIGNELWARQLRLLIEECWDLERRLEQYEKEMAVICQQDEVLASLAEIRFLPIQGLAAVVGAIGDVSRFRDVDQMKKYLNVAPQPLPQTGEVDEQGRPVQRWRFPANTYETSNGQRRLKYQSPGRKDVRHVGYVWFLMLMKGHRRCSEDPFARLYSALKASHQGKSRWLGRVRWKVVAKLVETIYYCLKYRRTFDPKEVVINVPMPAVKTA